MNIKTALLLTVGAVATTAFFPALGPAEVSRAAPNRIAPQVIEKSPFKLAPQAIQNSQYEPVRLPLETPQPCTGTPYVPPDGLLLSNDTYADCATFYIPPQKINGSPTNFEHNYVLVNGHTVQVTDILYADRIQLQFDDCPKVIYLAAFPSRTIPMCDGCGNYIFKWLNPDDPAGSVQMFFGSQHCSLPAE